MDDFLNSLIGNIDISMCKNMDYDDCKEDMHESYLLKKRIIINYYKST